jgi:hypothetical protein
MNYGIHARQNFLIKNQIISNFPNHLNCHQPNRFKSIFNLQKTNLYANENEHEKEHYSEKHLVCSTIFAYRTTQNESPHKLK